MEADRIKTFDNIYLHAEIEGKEDPESNPLICLNGVGVSTFFWNYLKLFFSKSNPIITWDYRGHGLSDQPFKTDSFKFNHIIKDLNTVIKYYKHNEVVLIGHSMGSIVALDYAHKHPDRVKAIVIIAGSYEHMLSHLFNSSHSKFIFEKLFYLNSKFKGRFDLIWKILHKFPLNYELAKLLVVNGNFCRKEDMEFYFEHISSINFDFLMKVFKEADKYSAKKLLPQINTPTLILGGDKDVFTPIEKSYEMYNLLPNAEIMIIPNGSHAAIIEQPELINLRIEKFLRDL
ncbi:MAG: alpha/beta hydrolase [Pseudomonadota bacterium]